MSSEVQELTALVEKQQRIISEQQETMKQQQKTIDKQQKQIELLGNQVKELQKENGQFRKEVEHLRKDLRKYKNENTPSGSIPPYLKPETTENEEKQTSERHQGKTANIRNKRPRKANRIEKLELSCCPDCKGKIKRKKRVNRRTVIKIILSEPETVRYEIPEYYCGNCRKEVRPKVPDALPNAKLDLTAVILMSVLFTGANTSVAEISNLFATIFGIRISPASVSNYLKRLKNYLGGEYQKIEEEIEKSKVRHYDETGWRKNGKTNYMWAVATARAAHYRIEKSRCYSEAKKLPRSKKGVSICDGYRAYDEISGKLQRCWSHMLRTADNPEHYFSSEQEYQSYWKLVDKLKLLYHKAKEEKRDDGHSRELRKKYEKKLDKLLKSVKHLGKNADKLMNYIIHYWDDWFTFLEYRKVDPTNNHAERMLRHAVLKRRISQQHRSTAAARSYAMQLSIYMSSRLKRQNYMEKLRNVVEEKINGVEKI